MGNTKGSDKNSDKSLKLTQWNQNLNKSILASGKELNIVLPEALGNALSSAFGRRFFHVNPKCKVMYDQTSETFNESFVISAFV